MPNEYALIGLVRGATPDKRMPHADDIPITPKAERAAARRLRGRFLRFVMRTTLRRGTRLLRLWCRRMAESNELMAMSDRELRDFGISRYDAEHAAKQAFWKAYRGGL
jgi:uncharacterized protein YjiS (DUF1127 family)